MTKLNLREGESIEFKASFQEKVIETLVAFANTHGGTVYIGVKDDSSVLGIKAGKETFQKWLNEIKLKTQPAIIPSIKEVKQGGKSFVALQVQEFPIKPLSFKGRYYKRVHNANHQLSAMEITDLNLQSLQVSWDSYQRPNKTFDDLDTQKVKTFIDKVNGSGRFSLSGNWIADLRKLKMIDENKVSNAAWLLFAKENTGYNAHIGRFKTPSHIIDDKMFNGTLFETVEQTVNYIISHLKVAFEITGKSTQRNEIFEYPLPALRELVLNAIVHRDYLSPTDIQIKIFDNSISFFNPRKLYGNLRVEDLKKDNYQARTRNKLIAEAFYLTGEIEKYGSGFIRIREAIKDYPTMQLQIEEIPGGFLSEISYKKQKESDDVVENVVENVVEKKIITLIETNPKVSAKQMGQQLGVTERTIQRHLKNLLQQGKLKRQGSARGGKWVFVKM